MIGARACDTSSSRELAPRGGSPPIRLSERTIGWRTALGLSAIAVGVLGGVGLSTFQYADGFGYLSEDPAACVNCHIMWPQYDSWQKSSHHTVAVCVDCHLPTEFVHKYMAKAEHGWNHSKGFTLQNFAEPIEITQKTADDLQANCLRCHGEFVHQQSVGNSMPECQHCHDDVGHGPRAGLGAPMRPGETAPGDAL